jgi:hypothetical protein
MKHLRLTLVVVALIGLPAAASADEMALTRSGDLYRITLVEEGLAISGALANGTTVDLLVPQTSGIVASSFQVGVDEATDALFALWQENQGPDATVMFASYSDGVWFGPEILAGGDGFAAANPQLLVFHHSAELELEGEEEPLAIEDTMLHIVWWSYQEAIEDGVAFYANVTVGEDGLADLDDLDARPLSDLLAFGIACPEISDAESLAHPRLFVDPQSGNPHVFATDVGQCLFQILELQFQPELDPVSKRRRRVIIFGRSKIAPVRSDVSLKSARVEVGHNLSLVIFWDKGEAIDYLKLDDDGWSEMRSLPLDEHLHFGKALELIQTLTH